MAYWNACKIWCNWSIINKIVSLQSWSIALLCKGRMKTRMCMYEYEISGLLQKLGQYICSKFDLYFAQCCLQVPISPEFIWTPYIFGYIFWIYGSHAFRWYMVYGVYDGTVTGKMPVTYGHGYSRAPFWTHIFLGSGWHITPLIRLRP